MTMVMAIGLFVHKHFYLATIEQSVLDNDCCLEEKMIMERKEHDYYPYTSYNVNVTKCVERDQLCKLYKNSEDRTLSISLFPAILSVISIPYFVSGLRGLTRLKDKKLV